MLVWMYLFFEIAAITLFLICFFKKGDTEILWVITLVIFGVLMFTSYNIENYAYELNSTSGGYVSITQTNNYPYLMGVNLLFFGIALILTLFEIITKYAPKFKTGGG